MATSHTRLKARDYCTSKFVIVQKAETVKVHFTLEGEGLRAHNLLSQMKSLHPTW